MTHYTKYSLLGIRRVILSIITRNFFVIQNKQPMTIGTNRMCIGRDDNMRQQRLPSTTTPDNCKKTLYDDLLSWLSWTCRVVLSVSYLLVSDLMVNFLRRVFSVCHSFRSMCQSGLMKGFERCFKVEDQ